MGLCVPLSHSHEHLLYQSILAQPSLPAGSSEGRSSVPFFMFSFFFENLTQYILVIFLYFPQVFFPDPPTPPYPPNFMFCLFYYKINTHRKNKTKIKTSVCSVLASYSWAWGLHWSVVDIRSITPLKKTSFSSSSNFQLWIASWLAVGLCACLLSSMLWFCLR